MGDILKLLGNGSFSVWGTVVAGGIQAAETTGMIPPGTMATVVNLIQAIAATFGVLGFARRLPRPAP